jgi:hypothetical protein
MGCHSVVGRLLRRERSPVFLALLFSSPLLTALALLARSQAKAYAVQAANGAAFHRSFLQMTHYYYFFVCGFTFGVEMYSKRE